MKIGLIDVDGHNYPNIPLMKLSAYHKSKGDTVEWYEPLFGGHFDMVYMAKVFSFTPDYLYPVNADKVIKGGSGYCITTVNGRETFDKTRNVNLPDEIEHTYPDYSLYPEFTKDTAYGFLSRGCPRGCDFCHVAAKEGQRAYKVADLAEFWRGQKNIILSDPNLTACPDWKDLMQQLINSRALVEFNQGLDVRVMTEAKAEMLRQIRIKRIHFAWDRYEDKDLVVEKLKMVKSILNLSRSSLSVFVLTNFNTTLEQDLERIYTIRDLGYSPYVAIYNRKEAPQVYKDLQRYVNMGAIFNSLHSFEEYKPRKGQSYELITRRT